MEILRNNIARVGLPLAAAALVLSGCSGNDESEPAESTAASASSSPAHTENPPEATASEEQVEFPTTIDYENPEHTVADYGKWQIEITGNGNATLFRLGPDGKHDSGEFAEHTLYNTETSTIANFGENDIDEVEEMAAQYIANRKGDQTIETLPFANEYLASKGLQARLRYPKVGYVDIEVFVPAEDTYIKVGNFHPDLDGNAEVEAFLDQYTEWIATGQIDLSMPEKAGITDDGKITPNEHDALVSLQGIDEVAELIGESFQFN